MSGLCLGLRRDGLGFGVVGVVGGGDAGFDLGDVAGEFFAQVAVAEEAGEVAGLEGDHDFGQAVLFVDFGFVEVVGQFVAVELGLLAQGVVGGFLEEGDGFVEAFEEAQFGVELGVGLAVPAGEEAAELGGQDAGEIVGQGAAQAGFVDFGGGVGEGFGGFGQFLGDLPFEVAALAPGGEVLFVDGGAVEVVVEGFEDVGQGVEPVDNLGRRLAFFQAEAEFVADVGRELGDFAVACAVVVAQELEVFEGGGSAEGRRGGRGGGGVGIEVEAVRIEAVGVFGVI